MRLRTKLLIVSIPLVLLMVAMMTHLAQKSVQEIVGQEVAKRGLSVTTAARQEPGVVAGFRNRDEKELLPALQSMLESTQALYAMALDSSGRVLAHTNVAEKGKTYDDPVSLETLRGEGSGYRRTEFHGQPVMDVSCLVQDLPKGESGEEFLLLGKEGGGEKPRLGVLRLGLPLKDALETADRISRQVFWIITGGSGLALALSLLFASGILRPVRILADATQRLGRGKLGETVPVLSSDEIGELAESFNRMSEDLAETTVSKEFLDSILKEMQDALIVTTPQGHIRMLNKSALDLLKLPEAELMGKQALPFFEFDEILLNGTELRKRILANAIQNAEGRCLAGSGEKVPILMGASGFLDEDGQVAGYILTVRDITEQKLAEEERRQFERQVVQAERLASVGTVAAGIVHNLKNPLSGIVGFAELLKERFPDLPFLDKIVASGVQMEEMIENILQKSRQKRAAELVDLNELLKRELDFLQADLIFKHEVQKDIRLMDGLPPIKCVYTDLSQVFGNLLRNGVEAMHGREKKQMGVRTVLQAGKITVEISDTGCGISKENLPHLFRPFFTTKNRTGDGRGPIGTGLGLYTSQQLLEPYGATIEVETEVDVGTTFRVRIPTERDSASAVSDAE